MESDVQLRELQKQNLLAEILRTSGKVKLAARGYSMLPALWPGDILNVETAGFERVQVGDVVLYERWNRFFIHRVLQKFATHTESERPSLVTRGDSMMSPDPAISPESLLGIAVSLERVSGQVLSIPNCSLPRRAFGLALGYSVWLRSVALRVHAWRRQRRQARFGSAAEVKASEGSPVVNI